VDTALAGRAEVEDFAENFGPERIIFGSDYPFGVPAYEKQRLDRIFSGNDLTAVLAGNLLRLLAVPARDTFSLSDK
jgi:predicted TIM-barrel fold metal-dependent hydrolase